LIIADVSASGEVSGVLAAPIGSPGVGGDVQGFWDEDSQRIVFTVSTTVGGKPPALLTLHAIFTGFLFEDKVRITGVSGGTVYTLAGHFETFGEAPTMQQSFGWYAQIGFE
jgi:hypothetical protein